jgi:hypothetical protein
LHHTHSGFYESALRSPLLLRCEVSRTL